MFEGIADQVANEGQGTAETPSAPEQSQQQSHNTGEFTHQQKTTDTLPDLEKFEKFRYDGKEWTPSDLKKAMMLEKDYRQKTTEIAQQRKAYESYQKEQEFEKTLKYDLAQVKANPTLESKFKEIYPERFHQYLDIVRDQAQGQQGQNPQVPREILEKIQAHEQVIQSFQQEKLNAQTEANLNMLDTLEKKFTSKYPHAQLDSIYTSIDRYITENKIADIKSIPEKSIEQLFKTSHERMQKLADDIYSQKIKAQKEANTKAKDIGRGGGTPGQAPAKTRLKDVQDEWLASLKN